MKRAVSILIATTFAATGVAQVSPQTGLPVGDALETGTVQGAAPRATESVPNGYISRGNQTLVVANGRLLQLTQPVTLTILPDGTLIGFNGQKIRIPDGLMLTSDGRLVDAPEFPGSGEGNDTAAPNSAPSEQPTTVVPQNAAAADGSALDPPQNSQTTIRERDEMGTGSAQSRNQPVLRSGTNDDGLIENTIEGAVINEAIDESNGGAPTNITPQTPIVPQNSTGTGSKSSYGE